eukprot:747704-Hanusia_phi.AAC.4
MLNIGSPQDRILFYRKYASDKLLSATKMSGPDVMKPSPSGSSSLASCLQTFAVTPWGTLCRTCSKPQEASCLGSRTSRSLPLPPLLPHPLQIFAISSTQDVDHVAKEVMLCFSTVSDTPVQPRVDLSSLLMLVSVYNPCT